MSPFGLKIYEWLQDQGDVTFVRDDSDQRGESVTCCFGGMAYRILLSQGPVTCKTPDYRENRRTRWDVQ